LADHSKNIGIYGAVGVLVAALIIASVVVGGVYFPSLRLPSLASDKGRLIIEVMDKPVDLKHLNITIDRLSIQRVENETEEWIDLDLLGGESVYFDLLALQNVTMTLSDTEIPTGNYTQLKMHVLTANATYLDGETVELRKVPSGHIKVLLKPRLEMRSAESVTVIIDLEPNTAKIGISQSLSLKPTMKAIVDG
jgi:hypothetical protein